MQPGEVAEVLGPALVLEDVQDAVSEVNRLVTVQLKQTQFDALVSFEFNTEKLAGSTMLRMLNAEEYTMAAGEFTRFVYASGVRMAGLVSRREREKALFLS